MSDRITATDRQIDNTDEVAILNNLIRTCRDGEESFRQAENDVKESELEALFDQYSTERAVFVEELTEEVTRLGGTPETSGSVSGAARRGWIDVKSVVAHRNRNAILDECERVEAITQTAYENALLRLSATRQSLVQRQYTAVKNAHDRILQLRKESYKAS